MYQKHRLIDLNGVQEDCNVNSRFQELLVIAMRLDDS